MNSRTADYLPVPVLGPNAQPSQPAFQELHNLAQKQIADRMGQFKTYVQVHPLTGIGAAFCIGIFLGWVLKRR